MFGRKKKVEIDMKAIDISPEEKEWLEHELKECEKRGVGLFAKIFFLILGIMTTPLLIGVLVLWYVFHEDRRRKEDCKDMVKTRFLMMKMSKR